MPGQASRAQGEASRERIARATAGRPRKTPESRRAATGAAARRRGEAPGKGTAVIAPSQTLTAQLVGPFNPPRRPSPLVMPQSLKPSSPASFPPRAPPRLL